MATPGVASNNVPPVPEHTPPRIGDMAVDPSTLIARPWAEWFNLLRIKINIINQSLVDLGALSGDGIVGGGPGGWHLVTLQGVAGQISITNGDAVAGNPIIGLANITTAGSFVNPNFSIDATGRIISITSNPPAVVEIVPGANITVDATDPTRPIVSSTASGTGIVETIVAGSGISVDSTDPANPIVSATGGGGGGGILPVVTGEIVSGQPQFVYLDDGSLVWVEVI